MPNTPMLVECGASVVARGSRATNEDVALVKKLFDSVGICEEVDEYLIDPVTALSGSGPAYVRINYSKLTRMLNLKIIIIGFHFH
jgi:pyrroline-5-carboxylate reductase